MTRLEELEQKLIDTKDAFEQLTYSGKYYKKSKHKLLSPTYDVTEANRLIRMINKLHTKINQEKQKNT